MMNALSTMIVAAGNSLELSIVVKATMAMILGLAAARLARRARASARHLMLASTFVALLILPVTTIVVPGVAILIPMPGVGHSAALPGAATSAAAPSAGRGLALGRRHSSLDAAERVGPRARRMGVRSDAAPALAWRRPLAIQPSAPAWSAVAGIPPDDGDADRGCGCSPAGRGPAS